MKIHVSTQASVSNYQAARAWHDLGGPGDPGPGAEPSEIAEIRAKPPRTWSWRPCPRGHVRVLLRPVPAVQLHDRARRQPGGLRPAPAGTSTPSWRRSARGVFPVYEDEKGTYILNSRTCV